MAWVQGSDKPPSRDAALLARAVYSCRGSALILLSVTLEPPCCPQPAGMGETENESWCKKAALRDRIAPWTTLPQAPLRVSQGKPLGFLFAWTGTHAQFSDTSCATAVPGACSFGRGCMCGAGKCGNGEQSQGQHKTRGCHTQHRAPAPPAPSSDLLVFGWRAGRPSDNLTELLGGIKTYFPYLFGGLLFSLG